MSVENQRAWNENQPKDGREKKKEKGEGEGRSEGKAGFTGNLRCQRASEKALIRCTVGGLFRYVFAGR